MAPWYKLKEGVDALNNNTFLVGIMILLTNLGARYIQLELTRSQEEFLQSEYMRKFMIFAVAFVATRDLVKSLILTGVMTTMLAGPLNERSRYCVLPEKFKNAKEEDGKQPPTEKEIEKAKDVLRKAKEHHRKNMRKQRKAAGATGYVSDTDDEDE
jgi:carbamoylphosphate synthase small subunit